VWDQYQDDRCSISATSNFLDYNKAVEYLEQTFPPDTYREEYISGDGYCGNKGEIEATMIVGVAFMSLASLLFMILVYHQLKLRERDPSEYGKI
jgi:hypothetical protein